MIKRIFKSLGFSTSVIIQIFIFLVAILAIFTVSYVLGHGYLEGTSFSGNDSYSYFSVINWYNGFFPNVPYWFANQGGGISFLAGYPYAPAYFVILLERLSSLDLIQSFRLLGFLSVPIMGIGVFVFCWTRLTKVKPVFMRQILGIIAALFYVTSPLAWIWLNKWGFYSESISHMFVPWTLIFFDLFLSELFNKGKTVKIRLYFVLTAVFLVITTWVHIFSGFSVIPIFFVLGLYRFIFSKEKKIALLKRIAPAAIALGVVFICLFAFRYFEFTQYYKFVADGGFTGYKSLKDTTYEELARNTLTTRMTLSLDEPQFDQTNPDPTDSYRSTIRELRFPFFVWVLIAPVVIFGFFRSKKMFALSLYVVLGLLASTSPNFILFLGKLGPIAALGNFPLQGRIYFIPMRVVIPVVAAYGAFVTWDLLGGILSWITNKVSKYLKFAIYPIRVIAVLVLTLITTSVVVYKYYNLPYARTKTNMGCDNPVDLRDIWSKKGPKEREQIAPASIFNNLSGYKIILDQMKFENWPKITISNNAGIGDEKVPNIFTPLPAGEYRYDISGYSGRLIMLAPLVSNNSQIEMYINTLSLIYNMWNYQTQVMYVKTPQYQKPGALTEVSKWFGLDYVFLSGGLEPLDYWKQEGSWEKITDYWWKFKEPTGIVDVSNKPKILIVSDVKRGFYDQTFRFFNQGALSYDKGIPVVGEKEIDSYSLNELTKYDAVIMRGYGYKIKPIAYKLLDRYVKGGGKLIFDTGWQYNIPDWEIKRAPSFMPFDSLTWQNLATDGVFKVENAEIAGNVDGAKFGNLSWEGTSWGVSVPGKLRPWAKPIVSYDGKTLAAGGTYGKGKIIWTGFNIIPHAEGKESVEEIYFFGNLLKYLIGDKDYKYYPVTKQRPSPDEVIFTLKENTNEKTNLFFKEAYHPFWHAYVYSGKTKKEVPILKAGPGFKLVALPKLSAGDKVVFKIKIPLVNILTYLLSITTMLALIVYIVNPKPIREVFNKLSLMGLKIFKMVVKIPKKIFNIFLGERDDDYQ